MNKVILIGRLTKDPELRFLPGNGTAVSTFTLAVDKNLSKDKKQEFELANKPTADFLRTVVWGRQAENCANYLAKGRLVAVEGRIETRNYENSEGQRVYITEVVAERVQFLEFGNKDNNNSNSSNNGYGNMDGFQPVDDEDIPF
ncbi:single-stranded DNA-binding protein [Senegalia massiliensis]|uniref:Single-stranded DNA-binding protein n=1 Tax=Senegalia massiliensis TaxID=1720316 RepID=A0A845R351_9CLOT|nr:single-stranded DNA-binding protein [Senegalia massiliensis]